MSWKSADVKDWLSRNEPENGEEQVMLINALTQCRSTLYYAVERKNEEYIVWGGEALILDDEEDLIRFLLIINGMELDIGEEDFDDDYASSLANQIPNISEWLKMKGFSLSPVTAELVVPWQLRSNKLTSEIRSMLELGL